MRGIILIITFLLSGISLLNAQSGSYCAAGSSACDEYVASVAAGSFLNSSSCGLVNGYSDYTSMQIPVSVGQTTTLTVTNGNASWPLDVCGIWIDWNNDFDFEDGYEQVLYQQGTGPYTAQITSPVGISAGQYRMRIRISYDGTNPCGTLDYGEAEDYTINLTSGSVGFTCGTSTVTDFDGNIYNTVLIGTQCWMRENLNVGSMITGSQDQTNNSSIEKYCYNNLSSNCDTYGGLYQWNEMMQYSTTPGVQGICPAGWHLPVDAEWTALLAYVGSVPAYTCNNNVNFTAQALAATTMWYFAGNTCYVGNNLSANNATGFTALPGGYSLANGTFNNLNTDGYWWSSTEENLSSARLQMMVYNTSQLSNLVILKSNGSSVRCVKDSVTTAQLPSVTTLVISSVTQSSAAGGGEVTSDGGNTVTDRGVCWNTTGNPTISDDHTSDGTGTGIFSSSITGLNAGTLYYVNAYATNSAGTAYGQPVTFTTLQIPVLVIQSVPLTSPGSAYAYVPQSSYLPAGPCTFNLDSPWSITSIASTPALPYMLSGTYVYGTWYAAEYSTNNLVTINPVNGERVIAGNIGVEIDGLAFDITTNTLFGVQNYPQSVLYSIDINTGSPTFIAFLSTDIFLINLACNATGQLYSIDINNDSLGVIDKYSGAWTPIGPVGIDACWTQDMEFDFASGNLYWASYQYSPGNGQLRILNTADGSGTIVGPIQNGIEIAGLAIPYGTHDPSCYGINDGQIFISVSGGEAPYQFVWSNGETTQNLIELYGGTYWVTVTDNLGNDATTTVTLQSPQAISITTYIADNNCHDFTGASINLLVSGGTSPYTYLWSDNSTLAYIENVSPGTYDVTVVDAADCQSGAGIWLANPEQIVLTYDIYNVNCYGATDGAIDISVSGGYPYYYYEWSDGSTNEDISGLTAGTYNVSITDSNSCLVTESFTIYEPLELSVSPLYLTNEGTAYIFNNDVCDVLYGSYYFDLDHPDSINLIAEQTGAAWLLAGTWIEGMWYATEAPDYTTSNLVIVDPSTGARTIAGNLGLWINGLTWDASTHTLYGVTSTSSYQSYLYSINPSNAMKTLIGEVGNSSLPINLACSLDGQLFSVDLVSGYFGSINKNNGAWTDIGWVGFYPNYLQDMEFDHKTGRLYWGSIGDGLPNTLRIIDISTGSSTVVGDFPACAQMGGFAIPYGSHGPSCNGDSDGQAFVGITGGTQPYSYTWSDGATTTFLNNVPAGTYSCTVTDVNGCSATASVVINEPVQLQVSTASSSIISNGGTSVVTVSATGGTSPYTGTGEFTVSAGTYSYSVTDANGCMVSVSIIITQPEPLIVQSVTLTNPGTAYGYSFATLTIPAGPCSFSLDDPGNITSITTDSTFITGGTYVYGTWYAGEGNPGGYIYAIDPLTGSFNIIGNPDLWITALSFDITSNTLFAISWGNDYQCYLYTIDQNDASPALIGQISNVAAFNLACSKTGHLYSVDIVTGMFGEINKNNAVWTPIGYSGINPYYQQDIEFDYTSGTLYWASYQASLNSGQLRTINISTGASTLIGAFQEGAEISGFAVPYGTHGPDCAGGNDGEIYLKVSGGTEPYQYAWSNGLTERNPENLQAGTYSVTVTDVYGNIQTTAITITSPDTVTTDIISSPVLCNGGISQVTVSASGGVSPYSGTGSFTLSEGYHLYIVSDANGCSSEASVTITEPQAIILNISNQNASCPACADGNAIVTATGGTLLYSYIWNNGATTPSIVDLISGIYRVTVTDSNNCQATALVSISGGLSQQIIALPQGWSIFSTYIIPADSAVTTVLYNIVSQVIVVKNNNGEIFWPAYNVNQINYFVTGQGYFVKMSGVQILYIEGNIAVPEITPVNLSTGWNIIGYLRTSAGNIESVLINILNHIIVVKNGNGLIYWPEYNVNQIIDLIPGEGYQLKTNESCTLVYPSNAISFEKSGNMIPKPVHFGKPKNTGNNMTLGINLTLEPSPKTGDGLLATSASTPLAFMRGAGSEAGVFDQTGLLIGTGIIDGEYTAITLWGDDELTPEKDGLEEGEAFSILTWDPATGEEKELIVENWLEGDGLYKINGISITGSIKERTGLTGEVVLYQNVPNPFKGTTGIGFYLPVRMNVSVKLYDMLGETIQILVNGDMEAGKHNVEFISKDLLPGVYMYRLETPAGTEIKRMTILK